VSWNGHAFAGDSFLVQSIQELQPDFVISGHIHNSPFRTGGAWAARIGRTWVFNSGKQLGAPPAYIELDLDRRTAHWLSQAGEEQVALDATEVVKA
jgi:Icc-related predicted phosphoesterase